MDYYSTSGSKEAVNLETAVLQGLAPDGGLYMPAFFERLPALFFEEAAGMSFQDIAFRTAQQIMKGDIPDPDLQSIIKDVLTFDAPLVAIYSDCYSLELFHGPTLAFKDFGARFMARVMSYFMQRQTKELTILVATSGDTGSAVAHGFLNTPGINVILLYPQGKVSHLQEQQLTTMGGNITALEVRGTFDDCQRMVKAAFVDPILTQKYMLSSANSINIARLIPQSFYYIYSYSRIPNRSIPVCFAVPSGNFGNLTAGLFAKKLGLPVEHFVAATNMNNIVPQYLKTGTYTPAASIQTIANAMDVGNPSNFARMQTLFAHDIGRFRATLRGFYYSDSAIQNCMRDVYDRTGYILDPHGAVGYLGFRDFAASHAQELQGVVLETAHPAKFIDVVESTLETKIAVPERLAEYANRTKNSIVIGNDYKDLKEFLLN